MKVKAAWPGLLALIFIASVSSNALSAEPLKSGRLQTNSRKYLRLLPTCTTGKYSSGSTCKTCSTTCQGCVTSSTKCTSCKAGKYLSSNTCLSCSSNCATCSGSSTSCTSCYSSYILANSRCTYDSSLDAYSSSSTDSGSSTDSSSGSTSSSISSSRSTGSSSSISPASQTQAVDAMVYVGIAVGGIIFVISIFVMIFKKRAATAAMAKPGEVISSDSGIASPALDFGNRTDDGGDEGITFAQRNNNIGNSPGFAPPKSFTNGGYVVSQQSAFPVGHQTQASFIYSQPAQLPPGFGGTPLTMSRPEAMPIVTTTPTPMVMGGKSKPNFMQSSQFALPPGFA